MLITLNRLEEETELADPFILGYYDIIDSKYLGLKIHEPNDPLSQYIRDQIKPEIMRLLDKNINNFSIYDSIELNRLLNDPYLFDEKRFAHVELNERIRDLISKNPKGGELRYLNRLLLEEAYPKGIAKCKAPIIYKGMARKTTNPKSKQPKHHEIPYYINANPLVLKLLVSTIDSDYNRSIPEISKEDNYKLVKLREQVKWQLISESDYSKFENKIKYETYNASWEEISEKYVLMDTFLSSQYVLQFVKKHGFRWTIYRIHDMVRSWDRCWALGESAINSNRINNEADLECAQRLIEFHRSVEEGYRRLEEEAGIYRP